MTKEELKSLVEKEAQFLAYYANAESRSKFMPIFDFYKDLKPIGYTKRMMDLDKRCMPCKIASESDPITCPLEKLVKTGEPRNHYKNVYSPLELWLIRFKDDTDWLVKMIKNE